MDPKSMTKIQRMASREPAKDDRTTKEKVEDNWAELGGENGWDLFASDDFDLLFVKGRHSMHVKLDETGSIEECYVRVDVLNDVELARGLREL